MRLALDTNRSTDLCRGNAQVIERIEAADEAAGLTPHEVGIFVDAVLAMMEPVESYFMWRPLLRDPADEMVLEAVANGRAAAIVTFNQRDFGDIPLRFGIEV